MIIVKSTIGSSDSEEHCVECLVLLQLAFLLVIHSHEAVKPASACHSRSSLVRNLPSGTDSQNDKAVALENLSSAGKIRQTLCKFLVYQQKISVMQHTENKIDRNISEVKLPFRLSVLREKS